MENDIKNSTLITDKVIKNDNYAQNLYAALCNNLFVNSSGTEWSCSWRYAGGIIARIRKQGDYLDWYCSGSSNLAGFQEEGTISSEVKEDLEQLGWTVTSE